MKTPCNIILLIATVLAIYTVFTEVSASKTKDELGKLHANEELLKLQVKKLEDELKQNRAKQAEDSLMILSMNIDSVLLEITENQTQIKIKFHEERSNIIDLPFDSKLRLISDHLSQEDSIAWRYLNRP